MLKLFDFRTRAEARAFVEGVEFVNDSEVEVVKLDLLETGRWQVTVEDRDA